MEHKLSIYRGSLYLGAANTVVREFCRLFIRDFLLTIVH